jgi:ATP-dependent Clp protease adaptor protein ClpS
MSTNTDHESDVAVAEKIEIKEPSQYDVIVHNNDYTSYDEVILIISQSFEMSHQESLEIARKVDAEGRGLCGTYSKEIADMKIVIINMVKDSLIRMFPQRQREITMLKFTVEKS